MATTTIGSYTMDTNWADTSTSGQVMKTIQEKSRQLNAKARGEFILLDFTISRDELRLTVNLTAESDEAYAVVGTSKGPLLMKCTDVQSYLRRANDNERLSQQIPAYSVPANRIINCGDESHRKFLTGRTTDFFFGRCEYEGCKKFLNHNDSEKSQDIPF